VQRRLALLITALAAVAAFCLGYGVRAVATGAVAAAPGPAATAASRPRVQADRCWVSGDLAGDTNPAELYAVVCAPR
jgi:hypothetical protein